MAQIKFSIYKASRSFIFEYLIYNDVEYCFSDFCSESSKNDNKIDHHLLPPFPSYTYKFKGIPNSGYINVDFDDFKQRIYEGMV